MNISIVGTGYVGLVSGACFAEMGIDVTCVDIDEKKIGRLLSGEVPIYEPELDTLIQKNMRAGRLSFGTDLGAVVNSVDVVFIGVLISVEGGFGLTAKLPGQPELDATNAAPHGSYLGR